MRFSWENKAKLLEGLNRKNTNIVVIEIKDDEDVKPKDDEVKPKNETSAKPVSVSVPSEEIKPEITQDDTPVQEKVTPTKTATIPIETIESSETAETTEQANTQTDNITDNKTDNYEGEDDEDDSDDFDPDDTELV